MLSLWCCISRTQRKHSPHLAYQSRKIQFQDILGPASCGPLDLTFRTSCLKAIRRLRCSCIWSKGADSSRVHKMVFRRRPGMPFPAWQRRSQMPILICVLDRLCGLSFCALNHPNVSHADEKGQKCEDNLCFHGSHNSWIFSVGRSHKPSNNLNR